VGPEIHWYVGWGMIAAGFAAGAAVGLGFHREDFLGGYGSFRRRLLRLGHLAMVALGLFNVLFGLTVPQVAYSNGNLAQAASLCWLAGGIAMPAVCFLTAWRSELKQAFAAPVCLLIAAAVLTAVEGVP
jgi:hypothetical protein